MTALSGRHAVQEALNAKIPLKELWVASHMQKSYQDLIQQAASLKVPVKYVSEKELNLIHEKHQHVIAMASAVKQGSLQALIQDKPKVVVMLDHLQDPHNMGAIIRTCVGLGIQHLIYPKDRNAGISSGVIRASAGAVYLMNLIQVVNLANTLQTLSKEGYWVYATHVEKGKALHQSKPAFPLVLIVGNEEKGISQRLLNLADEYLTIPMSGSWDSLNVSVATGIMLYHLVTQP